MDGWFLSTVSTQTGRSALRHGADLLIKMVVLNSLTSPEAQQTFGHDTGMDCVVHLIMLLLLPSKMVHTIATSKTVRPMDHIQPGISQGVHVLQHFSSSVAQSLKKGPSPGRSQWDELWLASAVHNHDVMGPNTHMSISEWAQVLEGCGHLLNNGLNLWNKETFSSVLYIFPDPVAQNWCRADPDMWSSFKMLQV